MFEEKKKKKVYETYLGQWILITLGWFWNAYLMVEGHWTVD